MQTNSCGGEQSLAEGASIPYALNINPKAPISPPAGASSLTEGPLERNPSTALEQSSSRQPCSR
jgi:hypothetical protein